jgi:hypothetical protein
MSSRAPLRLTLTRQPNEEACGRQSSSWHSSSSPQGRDTPCASPRFKKTRQARLLPPCSRSPAEARQDRSRPSETSRSSAESETETWTGEQRAFAARDLSSVDYVYLWVDNIHVNKPSPAPPSRIRQGRTERGETGLDDEKDEPATELRWREVCGRTSSATGAPSPIDHDTPKITKASAGNQPRAATTLPKVSIFKRPCSVDRDN